MKNIKYYINKNNFIAAILIKLLITAVIITIVLITGKPLVAKAAYGLNASIKQVKISASPTVYYLDHKRGEKKAYVNMAGFLSYGNKTSDIKTISQDDLNKWPDIYLVKTKNSPAVYYIKNGKKKLIASATEFLNMGFNWSDVATISKTDLDSYITTNDSGFVVAKSNPVQSRLTIEIDSSSPTAGAVAPLNTKGNLLAVYKFKSTGDTTKINKLVISLKGIYNTSILEKVYLKDQNNNELGTWESFNDKKVVFNFSQDPIAIRANEEKLIKVYADLKNNSEGGSYTIQSIINSSADIKANATIAGDFPLAASEIKIVDYGSYIGKVKVEELAFNNAKGLIGSTEQAIGKFNIKNLSNYENVLIREIDFKNSGSALSGNLKNFKIKDSDNKLVAQTANMASDKTIKFKVNDYKIKQKNNKTFTIFADIADGEGKTVNLKLDNMEAVGEEYGYALGVEQTDKDETLTIYRETLGVTGKELKTSSKLFSSQTGVLIGVFQIKNNNRSIVLNNIGFSMAKNMNAPVLDKTVFLVNYDTGELLASVPGANLNSNIAEINLNNISLSSKKDITVALISDIPDAAKNGDYYQLYVNYINYQSENKIYYKDNINIAGVKLTVSRSNLYIYANKATSGAGYTKGQKGVTIASFIAEAASGDDVNITSLAFNTGSETSGDLTYNNGFSNLRAYINGNRVGNVIAQPLGGYVTFDGFNYKLANNGRVEIKIAVDTDSDLRVSETQLMITNVIAVSYKSGIATNIANININSYKTAFSAISAQITSSGTGSIKAGENNNLVGSFSLKNTGAESLNLKSLVITTSNDGFSNSLGYSNLTVKARSTNSSIGSISKPVAGANKINLSYTLKPEDGEVYFDVYINASEDVPTGSFQMYFGEVIMKGKTSDIQASISGDPTGSINIIVE